MNSNSWSPDPGIVARVRALRRRLAELAPERQVILLAVTKGRGIEQVAAAQAAGITACGESYVQEALPKLQALRSLNLGWHFIGPIQSNKTAAIAKNFDWVHGVERVAIAQRLAQARAEAGLPPLQVCLQVNISAESTKAGASPQELPELAAAVSRWPHLRLRGLMALPAPHLAELDQRQAFAAVRALAEKLRSQGHALDTLSLGTSRDFPAAVMEGSTIVRIGTAIFGERN